MKKENNSGKLNKAKLIGTIIIFAAIIFFVINCINIMQLPANEFVVENDSVSFEETTDGVIIRKETIVQGENYKNGMVQIVTDGKKTAKDEKIFRYYSNGEDKILAQIDELSKEINEIIEASEIRILSSDIASIEKSIEDTINKTHELNDIQLINSHMKKIDEYMDSKTEKTGANTENAYIKTLTEQKINLENTLIEASEIMTAPRAGLISYRIDGYEEILTVNDTKDFSYLTKDILNGIEIKSGAIIPISTEKGKIVDNFETYIAVYMDTERASFAEVGEELSLRIGSDEIVSATIHQINPVENSDAKIIVFKVDEDLAKYLEYRKIQVDVIWWEYDGLKVNNSAIFEENGLSYVLRKRLASEEKILVKVLRQNETYSIVDNYEEEELLEMGYSEDEIKDMNEINLYDKILVLNDKKSHK